MKLRVFSPRFTPTVTKFSICQQDLSVRQLRQNHTSCRWSKLKRTLIIFIKNLSVKQTENCLPGHFSWILNQLCDPLSGRSLTSSQRYSKYVVFQISKNSFQETHTLQVIAKLPFWLRQEPKVSRCRVYMCPWYYAKEGLLKSFWSNTLCVTWTHSLQLNRELENSLKMLVEKNDEHVGRQLSAILIYFSCLLCGPVCVSWFPSFWSILKSPGGF